MLFKRIKYKDNHKVVYLEKVFTKTKLKFPNFHEKYRDALFFFVFYRILMLLFIEERVFSAKNLSEEDFINLQENFFLSYLIFLLL